MNMRGCILLGEEPAYRFRLFGITLFPYKVDEIITRYCRLGLDCFLIPVPDGHSIKYRVYAF